MQCPTCGTNTPGTLGTCSNCNAPIDPIGRPAPTAPPTSAPVPQDVGDQTMVVPPLTPSWSSDPAPQPSALGPQPSVPAPQPSVPAPEPSVPAPAPESPSESTAPWSFDLDDEDDRNDRQGSGGFDAVTPPPPPAWAASPEPPAATPQPPAAEPPAPDPIVPDSWFRRTDGQRRHEEQAPQQWGAAQPQATQLDHHPMNMGAPPPMAGEGNMVGPHPMGPMGPDGMPGNYYPPPPHASNQASKPLLIAVSALVTIAVLAVGLVLWPDGESAPTADATPSPSTSQTRVAQEQPLSSPARLQAAEMNKVLTSSAATRRVLARALNGTARCHTLPAAIKGFQVVARHRGYQVKQTDRLKVDRLRNGERMRSSLRSAFRASLEADLRLLAWANRAKNNCRGRPRPDVSRAPGRIDAERRATIAKKQFVTLWNPVAKKAGLAPRQWNGV